LATDIIFEAINKSPNVFWLVTGVSNRNPERMEQLASGILPGVKGISDNKKILMHFLGIGRNAVLVMPASKVIELNDIYKIDYEEPEDLLDNDMMLLSRIWNKEHGTPMGRRGVLVNLSDRIAEILKKNSDRNISSIGSAITGGYISLESNVPEINSVTDLAEHVRERVLEGSNQFNREKRERLPLQWWKRVVSDAVIAGMRTYRSEGEWVVENDTLRVPEGSRLLVTVTKRPQDFPGEVRAQLKMGEFPGFKGITQAHIYSGHIIATVYKYGLDKRYDVRFIDAKKFEEIQLKLQMKHQYG